MIKREPGEVPTLSTRAESFEKVDKKRRYKQILGILGSGQMTAKEIAVEMHKRGMIQSADRNYAAPRLTELSKDGIVEPVGRKKCTYTGKTVAVYARRRA